MKRKQLVEGLKFLSLWVVKISLWITLNQCESFWINGHHLEWAKVSESERYWKLPRGQSLSKWRNRISNNLKFKTVNAKKVFKEMSWKRQREEDPLKSLKSKPEATKEGQRSSWTCIELTDVFVKEERRSSSSGRLMASCSWDKTSARTTSPSTQDDRQEIVAWQRKSELFMFYKDC